MAEGVARPEFDLCLDYGHERERTFARILKETREGHYIEVKSDKKSRVTGRIAIEFRQHGRPSGIAVTIAEWWTVELDEDVFLTMRTERMKALARRAHKEFGSRKMGDNENECVLVPVEWLTRTWRSV